MSGFRRIGDLLPRDRAMLGAGGVPAERGGTGDGAGPLYVPVTRKVSLTDETQGAGRESWAAFGSGRVLGSEAACQECGSVLDQLGRCIACRIDGMEAL